VAEAVWGREWPANVVGAEAEALGARLTGAEAETPGLGTRE